VRIVSGSCHFRSGTSLTRSKGKQVRVHRTSSFLEQLYSLKRVGSGSGVRSSLVERSTSRQQVLEDAYVVGTCCSDHLVRTKGKGMFG
jgi:hypothetical protein